MTREDEARERWKGYRPTLSFYGGAITLNMDTGVLSLFLRNEKAEIPIGSVDLPASEPPEIAKWLNEWLGKRGALTRPSSPASGEVERYSAIYQSKLAERYMRERDEARAALASLTVPARPVAGEVENIFLSSAIPNFRRLEAAARAAFRAGFAPDEDEAIVEQKWNEWPEDREKARKVARAVLASLPTARADIGEDAVEGVARLKEALEQSNDRLRTVERYRQGEASRLPAVDAAIALNEKALASLQSSGVAVGPSDAGEAR